MLKQQRGVALMEILVSILITTFGLLALAGLQTKMNAALMESFQRAQALTVLHDLTQRLQANTGQDTAYVVASVGTGGTTPPSDCSTGATRAAIDLCEWTKSLLGAAETTASGGVTTNVGAMIGARGCVEQLQAANSGLGICQPAVYRVSVAWQGLNSTVAPAVTCGANQYGTDDTVRRVVSSRVVIQLPNCR